MDLKGNLDNLMKEAQKMQERMQEAQKELANLIVTGEAGAGLVKVEMNGRHFVKKVSLADNILEEDKEMIEDLVAAAVNDAVNKIEAESRGKISDLTADLQLPPDFKLPTDEGNQ
jgi:nucleoid-associated protein EbfC